MKLLYLFIFNLLFSNLVDDYHYIGVDGSSTGMQSNAIYEMVELNDTLWLRTGSGLSFVLNDLYTESLSFYSISNNNFPFGASPSFIINENLMAISGAGAVTNLKTTALISAEDGIDALRNASNVNYSPPQG